MKDAVGRMVYVNRTFERVFHTTLGKVSGCTDYELFPKETADRLRANDQSVLAGGEPIQTTETVPTPDDPHTVWLVNKFLFCGARGAAYVGGIAVDFTVQQRAQQQLREYAATTEEACRAMERANDELRRKNQELDEFTFVASHELQEPLRKMTSFSTLLAKDAGGGLSAAARHDLDFITDAAKRMQTLIQDLLSFSRTGRAAMKREHIPLQQCVDRALIGLATRIEDTGASIERDPLPVVCGDPTLLTQLYQNLIGNALKFVPPGRAPHIRLTCEYPEGKPVLGVQDNGIGIKPEYCEQIFAPFKRLHARGEYEGSGIGLSICRKAVERHGGTLWVESQPGEGSHFRFTLDSAQEVNAWESSTANPRSSFLPKMIPAIKS
jgi:signal transduction histidine kinase